MPRNSITLVGRASELAFDEFEFGTFIVNFTLTTLRGAQPQLVVRCEGYGEQIAEQFELMDDGSLVGVIGTLTKGAVGALPLVRIERLEPLGQPEQLAEVAL